jgi:hypothetical protein
MSNRELKASAKAVFLRSSVNGLSLKRYEMCLRQEEKLAKKSSVTSRKPSNQPDGHAGQIQGLLYGTGSLRTVDNDGVIAEERPVIRLNIESTRDISSSQDFSPSKLMKVAKMRAVEQARQQLDSGQRERQMKSASSATDERRLADDERPSHLNEDSHLASADS